MGLWRPEVDGHRLRINNRSKAIAEKVRDKYKKYFSGKGAVTWRNNMIVFVAIRVCLSVSPIFSYEILLDNKILTRLLVVCLHFNYFHNIIHIVDYPYNIH